VGVGNVKLGMTMEEVHEAMGMNFVSTKMFNIITDRYMESNFRVDYDKHNIVNFIELINYITDYSQVFYEEVNVFQTKAAELVAYFERYANYNHDLVEAQSGSGYVFEDLGISLWRSRVFSKEFLKESWYKQMAKEEQEAELRFQYFETVSVWSKGYYDQ
jgi:hypothetical protein